MKTANPDGVDPSQHAKARAFYDAKTDAIIRRYGPGPKVHYHVGMFDPADVDTAGGDADAIRRRIRLSQERILEKAAEVWDASEIFTDDLLDLGCGLGGGSIYWAERFGARVTSVTNVASHVPVIEDFAAQAGVAGQVRTEVRDACDLAGSGLLASAAVAFESSSHMSRYRLFPSVNAALPLGGYFCIEDILAGRPEFQKPFDEYYRTQCGTLQEYIDAAEMGGFALDRNVDVTRETTEFWVQSAAWAESLLDQNSEPTEETSRLRSICWHGNFHRAWRDRVLEVRLLRFQKVRELAGDPA